ncbi:MAG: XdhC/CoxI family protein [Anaerolineales bacterium]|nr:XdhC/CoxI family protein [Anaerolineales bacterium]
MRQNTKLIHEESTEEILKGLIQALQEKMPAALATVVRSQGGSPAVTGMKILVHQDGSCLGNIGGGILEQRIRRDALDALEKSQDRVVNYLLREQGENAIGTLCGGEVEVFVEVYMPKPILLIVGGGHISQPLSKLGELLDYQVQVADVDPERGHPFDPDRITKNTYLVVVTENADTDEAILRDALPTPAPYIGMIGSQRKCEIVLSHLKEKGFQEKELQKIYAPVGLDLGGRHPAQVALAIIAEIEMLRNRGKTKSKSIIT